MYGNDDPRTALATAIRPTTHTDTTATIRRPQYVEFDDVPPTELSSAGSPTWYVRAQNFVLGLTRLRAGDSLTRTRQLHEYVVLMTDEGASLTVEAGGESARFDEPVLVAVPPGDSVLTAATDLTVTRLFDVRTEDLAAKACNADAYATPDPRVRPFEPWPDPTAGHRLRAYLLERIEPEPGRFGRIFRTSAFMVNFLDLQEGPRDPKLTDLLCTAGHDVTHVRDLGLAAGIDEVVLDRVRGEDRFVLSAVPTSAALGAITCEHRCSRSRWLGRSSRRIAQAVRRRLATMTEPRTGT